PRQTVRVHAGAPIPTLADAVLPLDWVEIDGRHVEPLRTVNSGDFVHRLGSDVQPGDVVVEQGAVLGAAQVGLLAAIGRSQVLVCSRPGLGVLACGVEAVDIDRDAGLGQVHDANSSARGTSLLSGGGESVGIGVVDLPQARVAVDVNSYALATAAKEAG